MKRIKQTIYRFAYRVASCLSDMTGGARLFVTWKLALAAAILGFSAVSLTSCPERTTCYDPAPMCYDPVPTCYISEPSEQPCPEEGDETARYDADDPRFIEDTDPEFNDSPSADSIAR